MAAAVSRSRDATGHWHPCVVPATGRRGGGLRAGRDPGSSAVARFTAAEPRVLDAGRALLAATLVLQFGEPADDAELPASDVLLSDQLAEAIGMTMSRHGLNRADVLAALRAQAFSHDMTVHELATHIVHDRPINERRRSALAA